MKIVQVFKKSRTEGAKPGMRMRIVFGFFGENKLFVSCSCN